MLPHKLALAVLLASAAGSIAFMLHAGRRQQSLILVLLFGTWVLSPFVAAVLVSSVSKSRGISTPRSLDGAMVIFGFASLATYGGVAFDYINAKIGFIFLVVPLASWLFIAVVVGTAVLISRVRKGYHPSKQPEGRESRLQNDDNSSN